MDRELGFDLYTLKLFLLLLMTILICGCTVSATLGIYAILADEFLKEIPEWQSAMLWISFVYIGFYSGIRLVGRSGFSAMKSSAEQSSLVGGTSQGGLDQPGPVDLDRFWG